jgi:L-alanine-DL-glutamate epimerase-like enolase superfamily enzyme
MPLTLIVEFKYWRMYEPFVVSRGAQTEAACLIVILIDELGNRGRGEGCGVTYAGETLETMSAQIEAVRSVIEAGVTRENLLAVLPSGGARCAIDSALWDLEAKRSGQSAFELAGVPEPTSVTTAFTIGIRSLGDYHVAAEAHSKYEILKIKVDDVDPLGAVMHAHRGAPNAKLIVDPNQSWSVTALKRLAPELSSLGVVLLEQPIKIGDEDDLDGYRCPIPLCADELVEDISDLVKAKGRFDVVNIKLDKTGGLTEALRVASSARAAGFGLMVGCMAGSSLSMAPAMVLAQQCDFVDLDGPLLNEDWPDGIEYCDGMMQLPARKFWG